MLAAFGTRSLSVGSDNFSGALSSLEELQKDKAAKYLGLC